MILVFYPDKYAIEKTINLFKNPGDTNPVGSMMGQSCQMIDTGNCSIKRTVQTEDRIGYRNLFKKEKRVLPIRENTGPLP